MSTRVHIGLSVRGALNWDRRYAMQMLDYVTDDNGNHFNCIEAMRDALMDQLSMGREVLPMSDCDAWDYKTGCQGHEVEQ